jgi:hypothetical protein
MNSRVVGGGRVAPASVYPAAQCRPASTASDCRLTRFYIPRPGRPSRGPILTSHCPSSFEGDAEPVKVLMDAAKLPNDLDLGELDLADGGVDVLADLRGEEAFGGGGGGGEGGARSRS